MMRILNLVLLALMIVAAAITYDMKHKAEKAAERVARLEAEIAREKDAMQLLRAELSMLMQPARLQAVVDRYVDHFKLVPFAPSQYARIDEIPMRSPGAADEQALADMIGGAQETIR